MKRSIPRSQVMRVRRGQFLSFWNKNRKTIILYMALCLVATVFVFLFSLSTSPIFRDYPAYAGVYDGADSLHFQTDGQHWLHGRIPYRDTFDHKGPIIYLVNMLGWWMGGESCYGIMVFQIISLTVTLVFAWKLSQLAKKSVLWGGISITIMLILMIAGYSAGNTVQEYNLPFLMIAMYYLVRYFYQPELGDHDPKWAFIYGISIGACLLLQLTHAIPVCAGVLVILGVLIVQKRWKNLRQNLLYGTVGVLVMWVPFAMYFLLNGALGDFIYCTLIFNFEYASNIGTWLRGMTGETLYYFITTFLPFLCLIPAAILAFARKKNAYATMMLITFALEAYLFLSARNYPQYALPITFQTLLLLNEIILFEHSDSIRQATYIGMISLMAVVTYNQLLDRATNLVDQYNMIRKAGSEGIGYEPLMDRHLDEIRNTTFTAYGHNSLKGIYVRYKLVSQNRVPLIQNWLSSFTEDVKKDIYQDFQDNRAEYLLVEDDSAKDPIYGISDILQKYYQKIDQDSNNHYVLYKLIDGSK